MKAIMGFLASLGVVGMLMILGFWCFMVCSTIYGLYLAFSASIILGILVLIVEPSPAIIGLVMIFFHKNLAQILIDWLNS